MNKKNNDLASCQDRWATFRFSIIGPLLSSPPEDGELQVALMALANKQWRHPITNENVHFSMSTIERWFYKSRKAQNPVDVLRSKKRIDSGKSTYLTLILKKTIQSQFSDHPSWSYQLHFDNFLALIKQHTELGTLPSYSTIYRYMKSNGLTKQRRVRKRNTPGSILAAARVDNFEVRSFEMSHVNALWHLDFHEGSFSIAGADGKIRKPMLLAILDDHSRLICHAQWFFHETAEVLVHGFMQALQKRGLPRALMSDNGSAMISGEFTEGLKNLSILHQPTLPLSPYQNGKQECFWGNVEGRLMAMLEHEPNLTLTQLNTVTFAWIEHEYHRKLHSEIGTTPLDRYANSPNLGRPYNESTEILRQAFFIQVTRTQRHSDGTISLDGKRFEIPSQYRHINKVTIRYARWDLSKSLLMDVNTNQVLCTLYLQNKTENASGHRRALIKIQEPILKCNKSIPTPPLLIALLAEFAATGIPAAYIPIIEEEKNA